MNTVPAALDLLSIALAGLLYQDHARESGIVVPEVDRTNAALEVHLAVLLEGRVSLDLELAKSVRGLDAFVKGRVVDFRPG